jgi:hypothetical protein
VQGSKIEKAKGLRSRTMPTGIAFPRAQDVMWMISENKIKR